MASFSFFFFAVFQINLVLHLSLGMRDAFFERDDSLSPCFFRVFVVFISTLLLWHFFVYVLFPLTLGFVIYFFAFPLCFLLYFIFTKIAGFVVQKPDEHGSSGYSKKDYALSNEQYMRAAGGSMYILAALMLTFKFALGSLDALFMAGGFSCGILLSMLALQSIRKRIAKENVPLTLRGLPLMLITTGLLSLVFSALASIILAR
jgi:electron transport complex protein RnfA